MGFQLLMLLWVVFGIWWLLYMGLALTTKAQGIVLFLGGLAVLVVLVQWALLGYGLLFFSYAFFLLVYIFLGSMIRIISEYERGVLFRFGRQIAVLQPGMNLVFPMGIDYVKSMDLRTFTIDVPKQEVITKDNVPILVDAVVYFNIFDPVLAVVKVADYVRSTSLLGQTILRSVLGQHDMDELLSKRNELNDLLKRLLDEATDPWGVKVTGVEVKAIELPESMKRAMARQAEAERERRAKVIAADGEYQASEKLAEAARVLAAEPASIQLRYLQTLTEIAVEKNSTILFPLPIELFRFFKDRVQGGE
ncbi:SPFH domain-containing protein [Hydrogenispora ethanolica]|uniref:SPFH domain-containing protein n=1 Tax=Hydrogenispora ethanolica TaxID=1082276 RepID=A0A4R1R8K9_HYDET|nr:slipin family protein [Hydrogenispora ethanolica]TCL61986.1 SPFH domain-containing protein [Hydrogenispora ethanolica]